MNPEILKKLLQYAPEPPASVWKGISEALDSGGLADKMQNFETAPPEGLWSKISQKLSSQAPGKLVKRSKFFTAARAAAAAAIIIIMAASIIFWNRDEQGSTANINTQVPVQQPLGNSQSAATENSPDIKEPGQASAQPRTYSVEPRKKQNRPSTGNNAQKSERGYAAASYTGSPSFIPRMAQEKAIAVSSYPVEKYMVYSDEEGNAMRVPKKLFELISCVKEEIICQQQVQQLQSRFASYVTSNDFTGLMEMLRNMKENK